MAPTDGSELPYPIASLLLRARNAKSPRARHDTAFVAWEAAVHLAVAARPPRDAATLARATLGAWVAAVEVGDAGSDDAEVRAAFALLSTRDPAAPPPARRVRARDLLDALPEYRNKLVGHGAPAESAQFYDAAADVLVAGLERLWRTGALVDAHARLLVVDAVVDADARLLVVDAVEIDGEGRRARGLDLTGDAPRLLSPGGWTEVPATFLPRRLYLGSGDVWRCLHPWVLYREEEVTGDPAVLFLHDAGSRMQYLDFRTGAWLSVAAVEHLVPGIGAELSRRRLFASDRSDAHDGSPSLRPARVEGTPPSLPNGLDLVGVLRHDATGVVLRARDPRSSRDVAVKLLDPAASPPMRERFRREMRILSTAKTPYLARMVSAGTHAGADFYVTELTSTAPLDKVLAHLHPLWRPEGVHVDAWHAAVTALLVPGGTGGAPGAADRSGAVPARTHAEAVAEVLLCVGRALQEIHESGHLHGDVRSANIAVAADGRHAELRGLDSCDPTSSESETRAGCFRPPDDEYTPSAEVFEVGATLFESLTLCESGMTRRFTDGGTRIRPLNRAVPVDLEAITARCLEREPHHRYATARDLADDLERFLNAQPVQARAPGLYHRARLAARRWTRRLARRSGAALSPALDVGLQSAPPAPSIATLPSVVSAIGSADHTVAATVPSWSPPAGPAEVDPQAWAKQLSAPPAGTPPAFQPPAPPLALPAPVVDGRRDVRGSPAALDASEPPQIGRAADWSQIVTHYPAPVPAPAWEAPPIPLPPPPFGLPAPVVEAAPAAAPPPPPACATADPLTSSDAAFSSQTVVTRYPAPIAIAYRRFLQQRDPAARLLGLFATVEATLRYLVALGTCDLLHGLSRRDPQTAALPDHSDLDFLRRPTAMTLGRWAGALREISRCLLGESGRLGPALPLACGPGAFVSTRVEGLVRERNVCMHPDGGLALTRAECSDALARLRPQLDGLLREVGFVLKWPLAFVDTLIEADAGRPASYRLFSCMGATPDSSAGAQFVSTTATLRDDVPFVVTPDGLSVLYLWPLLLERKSEHSARHTLFVFERIPDDGSRFLTQARYASIESRESWTPDRWHPPAAAHAWLFARLRELPASTNVPADARLLDLLRPARGGSLVGERLGPNRLVSVIASGGFGTVYLAEDDHGIALAVKVLDSCPGKEELRRFRQEFERLREMGDRPGIVRSFESGVTHVGGRLCPWYSMEYAPGGDLRSLVDARRGRPGDRMPWDDDAVRGRIAEEFASIADAVASLHRIDVVHRDIKPGNVLVMEDGSLRLSDFGLVKSLRPSESSVAAGPLSSRGAVLGTHGYMAPEQEEGQDVGKTTDVHALGVLLAELCTGDRVKRNRAVRQGSTIGATPAVARLPADLRSLIERCTDANPERRPQDAEAVVAAFAAIAAPCAAPAG